MFNLIINPESIRMSKGDSPQVFSDIYFQIGDSFYPAENWDDFSVVILGWWLQEARCIKPVGRFDFRFMDGPYHFEVGLIKDTCNINFISEDYIRERSVFSHQMKYKDFLDLLKKCADLLIRNLPVGAEKLEDVVLLKDRFKQLQYHISLFSN